MKKIANIKIGTKLIVGFLIVAVIAGSIGVNSILFVNKMQEDSKSMFNNYGNSQGYLGYVATDFQKQRVFLREIDLNPTDIKNVQTNSDSIKQMDQEINSYLDSYEKTCTTPKEQASFADLKAKVTGWQTFTAKLLAFDLAGDNKSAIALKTTDETKKIISDATGAINDAVKNNVTLGAQMLTEQQTDAEQNTIVLFSIVGGAVLAAILLGVFLSRSISRPLKKMMEGAQKLASGNMDVQMNIEKKDEIGTLSVAFDSVIKSFLKIVEDTNVLTEAATEGNLGVRIDTDRHQGDYKKLVEGLNNTFDAFTKPLNEASTQLAMMADGQEVELLDEEAYNGDFKVIIRNLNGVLASLYRMLTDSGMLAQAAADGKLDTRADLSRHKGGYQKIIKGVNDTMDAVITPINEAAAVLNEMAKGNLHVSMEGEYKGDYALIKNALNETIIFLKGYISEISNTLGSIANGDLSVSITAEFKGDFIALKNSINSIIESFNGILAEINLSADQVSAGAQQVSNGNQAISQGATEQASSIEELSSTISRIAEQTKENAENSKKSNETAVAAKNAAANGNMQMKEMLQSMEDINESSENISKIIKVIDDIAFQTNILALNAAVEAARAGMHGKGFAVVAEEVRNLASRSAAAAKETADLIEGSMKKVGTGTRIANNTAEALMQIVESVDKTVELGEKIAIASNDQALGINQVNQGIEQMSRVVQTNSATSQEGAAASEELSGQSELLKEKIGRFKLDNTKHINQDRYVATNDFTHYQKDAIESGSKY